MAEAAESRGLFAAIVDAQGYVKEYFMDDKTVAKAGASR